MLVTRRRKPRSPAASLLRRPAALAAAGAAVVGLLFIAAVLWSDIENSYVKAAARVRGVGAAAFF